MTGSRWIAVLVVLSFVAVGAARAALDVASPTTDWTGILYPGSVVPDPSNDQQTGSSEGDLVGNSTNASFYTKFDDAGTPSLVDGTLAFRARVGADKNPVGFATAVFVGLDADQDGALDLFLGVNNSGSSDHVGIWPPGAGANTSPNTTTIEAPLITYAEASTNYDWRAVDATIDPTASSFDIDGGGDNDYFVSFSVPFSDVVALMAARGIVVDENTKMRYVMATATQANSLNQDLNGVNGSVNSSMTWSDLGVVSLPITASGEMSPTAVVLHSFSVRNQNGRVTVRWQTASEVGTTGFDLYRKVGNTWVKVNAASIPSTGAPMGGVGATYEIVDAGAAAGAACEYKLVEQTVDGAQDYGPYERTATSFELEGPIRVTSAGMEIHWLSREGERYRVLCSTNLLGTAPQVIAGKIDATPPENVFVDPGESAIRVYRVEME